MSTITRTQRTQSATGPLGADVAGARTARPLGKARRAVAIAAGTAAALTIVLAGTPGLAAAATPRTALKAVLATSPTLASVGQTVSAQLAKSAVPAGDHVARITVSWGDGSKAATFTSLGTKATHAYLRAGLFTISATLTDVHGKSSTAKATEGVTLPTGSYTGDVNGYADSVDFYVSNTKTALQDVTIESLNLTCTPGGSASLSDLSLNTVPLKANGSFADTVTEHGVYDHSAATYLITFAGQFSRLALGEPTVTGTLKESLTYASGTTYRCTSGSPDAWTSIRDTVQTVTAAAPTAGSYTGGVDGYADSVDFYVSNTRTALQDVTIESLALSCTPGGNDTPTDLSVNSVPLSAQGSFATTVVEHAVYDSSPATYTITLDGNYHGFNQYGQARVAGSVTETLSYASGGTAYHCSPEAQLPWTSIRDPTQTVTTAAAPAGSYTGGVDEYADSVDFYVSNAKTALQDVTIETLDLNCSPGSGVSATDVSIDSVPLHANGSFDATVVEHAVYDSSPATYTITFVGNYHGFDAAGHARVAGSVTETLSYTSGGTAYSCTSGPQLPWTSTRDVTQTVTSGAPPAGSYAGDVDSFADAVSFSVPSGQSVLDDTTVGLVDLNCSPGTSISLSDVSVASVPVSAAGSFDTTDVQHSTYDGSPATYTITVVGNFHGLDAQGHARAAGSVTETLTYSAGGTSFSCSSGALPWQVAHS